MKQCLLVNFLLITFICSYITAVVVKIRDGKLLGRRNVTFYNKKSYYSFQGIPFASPPLGSLRFQAPVPPKPWKGILNATKEGLICIPRSSLSAYPIREKSGEDCLFINVYTPSIKKSAKLAVLFWIYGGGFVDGNGNSLNYGPDHFIDEDVILVTFNYRLGAFGFLSTEDTEILGNAGLKDQVMALTWTKSNIKYFGGDPSRITIFGESAGGMSVGLHLLSKKSAGLFNNAICHSGCSLSATMLRNPKSVAYELATAVWSEYDWERATTRQIKQFLTSLTAEEVATASCLIDSHKFIPTLEIENESAFLSEPNYELLVSGRFNQVPLIIGQVSEESLGFLNKIGSAENAAAKYDQNVSALVPETMNLSRNANLMEIGKIIKQAYLDNGNFSSNIAQLLNYDSANRFTRATLKQVELQSEFTPVFMYNFSFYGCRSLNHYIVEGDGKVGHFDDMPYFFQMDTFPCGEKDITKKVTRLWANFAKTSNPTPKKENIFDNVIWQSVEPGKIPSFIIDTNISMVDLTNDKHQIMWNEVYEKYAVRPFIVY